MCLIAEGLKLNSGLSELDFEWSRFGETGGNLLAEVVACNSTISTLNVQRTGLTTEVCLHFGRVLEQNTTLTFLNLGTNDNWDRWIDYSQLHYIDEKDWRVRKNMSLYTLLLPILNDTTESEHNGQPIS